MKQVRTVICRAAGLMGWVVACVYDDGQELLDLDIQGRTWQGLIPKAKHAYPGLPLTVEADPFWMRKR